jgi:ABC-2 type transport system permease protein
MTAIFAVWSGALKEAWAKPRALFLDIAIMVLNDSTWILFWNIFFSQTGSFRGWDTSTLYVFFSVMVFSFGLSLGLFHNARRIGQMVNNGELDAALTLPVDTLSYLTVRKIQASSLGDVVFGIGLFFIACSPSIADTLTFFATGILGAIVCTSFLAFMGSLTLHFGGKGEQQDISFDAITMFGFYPLDMFGGPVKVIMFTVLPAAFIGAVPAELILDFEMWMLGLLATAALGFTLLARWSFATGLKKYRSGSAWTRA